MTDKSKNKKKPYRAIRLEDIKGAPKPTKIKWWKDQRVHLVAAICLLTFVVLLPALQNEFLTSWDDRLYITENEDIKTLNVDNFRKLTTEPYVSNHHPLTMYTLAMNYFISGDEPMPFILTNILLHLVNTVLVFYFIWLLIGQFFKKEFPDDNIRMWIAGFVALFFAIHPMHVESVVWISERKDVLYLLFFMGALIYYLKYLESKLVNHITIAFIFFFFSLISKPAAVILPVVFILLDFLSHRKLDAKLFLEKIPFFGLALVFGLLTIGAQSKSAIGGFDEYTIIERIMFASYGFVMYIVKLFVPFKLSAFYPYPGSTANLPIFFKIAPFIALSIVGLTVFSLKYTRKIAFGVAFYFVSVALVLQFIEVGGAIIADRYTYLAYIGLLIPLAIYWGKMLQTNAKDKNVRYALLAVVGITALVFSGMSFQRTKAWKDSESLWLDVIKKYPGAERAYLNLGQFYYEHDQSEKALSYYNEALKRDPSNERTYNNRGLIFYEKKQYEKALDDYNNALSIDGEYWDVYQHRGNVYYEQKQFKKALDDYNTVIENKPNHHRAWNNRANIYFNEGNYAKAVENYSKVIEMQPNYAMAYTNRGIVYYQTGEYQKALQDFNQGLNINPSNRSCYLYRSYTHNELGDRQKALKDAQKAKQLGMKVSESYLHELKQ